MWLPYKLLCKNITRLWWKVTNVVQWNLNCSVDGYVNADNSLATSEKVDVIKTDQQETLWQDCLDQLINEKEETLNPNLGGEGDKNNNSLSGVIGAKGNLSLLSKGKYSNLIHTSKIYPKKIYYIFRKKIFLLFWSTHLNP